MADNHGFQNKDPIGYESQFSVSPIKKTKRKWTCCQITFIILGTFSTLMGIAMVAGGYGAMFDAILQSQLEVSDGSRSYEIWKDTPVPLFLHFYFFNITNGEEFQEGAKPILDEVGPYCYREFHSKQNLTFNSNATVTFLQQRWWTWDEECSGNYTEQDEIVLLNSVPVSAAWTVRHNKLLLSGLNQFLNKVGEDLILTATVREVVFDGFEDPILDWMTDMKNKTLPPDFPDIDLPEIHLPPGLTDYDKFGWFYKRNMSLLYDGLFNMFTGEDTLENLGGIDNWNNKNVTDFFESPCNMLNGSAGELWPPNQEKDLIQFYSSDLCMSMKLFYEDEVEDDNGVSGYRYIGTNETFTNGTVTPGNDCFCVNNTCAPTGLLNAESCRMGSPAFISFPHFLHADPFLLDAVDGMDPDEDLHSFFIDLVPELGTPMYVAARMQINMHVIPYKTRLPGMPGQIDMLANVPDVYLPLLWFEELAGLPEDLAGELKALLFIMNTPVMDVIWGLMIGLGLLSIILSLLCHYGKIGCCCCAK